MIPAEVGLRHGSLPLALCKHDRCCRRGVKPAHDRRKQSQIRGRDVVLEQITEIRKRADRNHRQPHVIGRERSGRGYRLIGDEGKNDTDQNQEFPGGHQFVPRNNPDQPMQPLARADEQHSGDGDSDRHPGRLCQRDWPDQIGYQAGNGNDQRRRSRRGCRAPQMSVQPQRQCNEAGDERERVLRIDHVQHRPTESEQWKCAHPAGAGAIFLLIDFLESQPDEHREPEAECNPSGQLQRGELGDCHEPTLPHAASGYYAPA